MFILVFKISNAQIEANLPSKSDFSFLGKKRMIVVGLNFLEADVGKAKGLNLKMFYFLRKNITMTLNGHFFAFTTESRRRSHHLKPTDFFYKEYSGGCVIYQEGPETFFIVDLMGNYHFFNTRRASLYASLGAGIVTDYGGNPGYTANMALGGNLWFSKYLGINTQFCLRKPLFYQGFFFDQTFGFGLAIRF